MAGHRIGSTASAALTLLFCALTCIDGAAQSAAKGPRDEAARELLQHLQRQVSAIRANQVDYVAEEEQQQEEYDDRGKLKKQRRLTANYYRLGEWGGRALECREVVSVDGKPVIEGRRLQEFLLSKDKSLTQQLERVSEESKKYNLGYKSRDTNQPAVGVRFSDGDLQNNSSFFTEGARSDLKEPLRLSFREDAESTLFQHSMPFSKWPMPAAGEFLFSGPDRDFVGYDISIHDNKGKVRFRLLAGYDKKKDGKLLPIRFEEFSYDKNGKVKTRSMSEYKNYRRFDVEAKILDFESIEQ